MKKADYYLRRLHYRYKLNKRIWNYDISNDKSTQMMSTGQSGVVRCFDDALPSNIFHKLQDVFAIDSPFWSEHGYPTDEFFSYNVLLTRKKKCKNLIEQVAKYVKPLVAANFPDLAIDKCASIEWWAHTRSDGASAGHRVLMMNYVLPRSRC